MVISPGLGDSLELSVQGPPLGHRDGLSLCPASSLVRADGFESSFGHTYGLEKRILGPTTTSGSRVLPSGHADGFYLSILRTCDWF